MTSDNIESIISTYTQRTDKGYISRLVSGDEIEVQDYNLSVSSYVEQEDTREIINLAELNAKIDTIVAREQVLRDEITKIVSEIESGAGNE